MIFISTLHKIKKNFFFHIKINKFLNNTFLYINKNNLKNFKSQQFNIIIKKTLLFKKNVFSIVNNLHKDNKTTNTNILIKPTFFNKIKNNTTSTLLRKQKIYTKNKFSRSRQYCKNIVLFGLLLNITLMFGLNSSYYALLINTGYFIHVVYCILFIASIYIIYKYKLYSLNAYKC